MSKIAITQKFGEQIFVSTGYNDDLVKYFKSRKGSSYCVPYRTWALPVELESELVQKLKENNYCILECVNSGDWENVSLNNWRTLFFQINNAVNHEWNKSK